VITFKNQHQSLAGSTGFEPAIEVM